MMMEELFPIPFPSHCFSQKPRKTIASQDGMKIGSAKIRILGQI